MALPKVKVEVLQTIGAELLEITGGNQEEYALGMMRTIDENNPEIGKFIARTVYMLRDMAKNRPEMLDYRFMITTIMTVAGIVYKSLEVQDECDNLEAEAK